jgi:hypothetical protein
MSTPNEYRLLALRQRILAQRERLPQVRAVLTASAERWEFLAEAEARADGLEEFRAFH